MNDVHPYISYVMSLIYIGHTSLKTPLEVPNWLKLRFTANSKNYINELYVLTASMSIYIVRATF